MESLITGIITLVVILQVIPISHAKLSELPEYIQTCKRNDPDLPNCIIKTLDVMKPYLKSGIDDLRVPPFEPLDLGELNILEGGPTGFTVKAKNLKVYGPAEFKIKKMTVRDNAQRFDFDLLLPILNAEGNYELNGNLLSLPLKGNGPFVGNFTNFMAFVKVEFEPYQNAEQDNIQFLRVKTLQVKVKVGKGKLKLYNLFNGDKTIGDVVNETINNNFEAFATELIGPIEKALEKKFLNIAKKIMDKYSHDQLFPL